MKRTRDLAYKFACIAFPITMVYVLITDGDGCGDTPMDFKFFPIMLTGSLVGAAIWSLIDRQRREYDRLWYGLQILTRYFLCYMIIAFGYVKIVDLQFTPNLFALDARAVDMHPQTLTWTFFGFAYSYEIFIGCGQVLASVLLLWRRTATLGALLLVTIMANVVFVNFAYDVCVKFFSSVYLVMAIFLVLDDAPRLVNMLLLNKTVEVRRYPELSRWVKVVCGILIPVVLIAPAVYIKVSAARYDKHVHNTVYGVWMIDSASSPKESLNLSMHADTAGWRKLILGDWGDAGIKNWQRSINRFNYSVDSVKHTMSMKSFSPDTVTTFNVSYRRRLDTLWVEGFYNKDPVRLRAHLNRKYFIR